MAFGRVFRGCLRPGQHLYVLGDSRGTSCIAQSVFLSMGRAFHPIASVPAGNLAAVVGCGSAVVKSATLGSNRSSTPLLPLSRHFRAAPVVRVAVHPANGVADLPALAEGLRRLHAIDPLVEVLLAENGEHVICAAGEVHLETCLRDLEEVFAKVPVSASKPLVAFKETVHSPSEVERGVIWYPWASAGSSDGRVTVRARACAIPSELSRVLLAEASEVRTLLGSAGDAGHGAATTEKHSHAEEAVDTASALGSNEEAENAQDLDAAHISCATDVARLREDLLHAVSSGQTSTPEAHASPTAQWLAVLRNIWTIGSKGGAANLLLCTKTIGSPDGSRALGLTEECIVEPNSSLSSFWPHVAAGFQLACAGGPLCEEPLFGVAFEVEVAWDGECEVSDAAREDPSFFYRVMLLARDAMRAAVLSASPRLVQAMYSCEIATSSEGLNGTYAALGRTRGRVLNETMVEGTGDFLITALVPVVRSFGFVEDLRKRSGGCAGASMVFSHWEELDADPLARTMMSVEGDEDGIEDESLGNLAVVYVDAVRRRKGLPVEEKVVKSATKQRTRARKV